MKQASRIVVYPSDAKLLMIRHDQMGAAPPSWTPRHDLPRRGSPDGQPACNFSGNLRLDLSR